MSRLTNLLRELEKTDPQLAADIGREISTLSDRRAFGLNFERHVPESVELPGRPIRRGDKVRFLPQPAGLPDSVGDGLWRVIRVKKSGKKRVAELVPLMGDGERTRVSRDTDDLVAVAEFRDPIYPGLVSTGRVERGGDKPFHTLINAENYHALEALLYTHEGSVDAIYIDPPYNTGAKDWKYNNDYVDAEDVYRHSKWLAMMERRLLLAKRLLKSDGVLICTIDENELHHLGGLLETSELFGAALRQLVTICINPGGAAGEGLSRVEEYAVFCFLGDARPVAVPDDMLVADADSQVVHTGSDGVRWEWLMRGGSNWYRSQRPNLCYPILLSKDGTRIFRSGAPWSPPDGDEAARPTHIDGHPVAWPVRKDGKLGIWRTDGKRLDVLAASGYAYVSKRDLARDTWTIKYLMSGTVDAIENGIIEVKSRDEATGRVVVEVKERRGKSARTMWVRGRHVAGGAGGTQLLNALLGARRNFPFPKSVYAVLDCLDVAIGDRKNAVVLDFFAGSGTTAHAVQLLNHRDGGRRKSILVTNNEVSAVEQAELRAAGFRPGDPEWEAAGICEQITKPRIKAALIGTSPFGDPVDGTYRVEPEFPVSDGLAENAEFFELTYEAPRTVAHNKAFARIAPLLWLRAGAEGRRIEGVAKAGFEVADSYGVLFDLDQAEMFTENLRLRPGATVAFIVSDDERAFQSVCAGLPEGVEGVRLYSSYLTNFEINARADQQ